MGAEPEKEALQPAPSRVREQKVWRSATEKRRAETPGRQKPKNLFDREKTPRKRRFAGLSGSVKLIVVAVVAGVLGFNLLPVGIRWYSQEQEHKAVLAEVEAARQRNVELEGQLAAWDDPNYVAAQARARLGFVWPGETLYNVVGLPETTEEDSAHPVAEGPQKPWSTKLLESMIDADHPPASSGLVDLQPGSGEE